MSKTIKFTIEKGVVAVEASGFKGSACDVATKAFEDDLGTTGAKSRKAEFYQKTAGEHLSVGGGQ